MPSNQESTQVMNPLLSSSLSSHGSMLCAGAAEPKPKKMRLEGLFHAEEISPVKKSVSTNMALNDGGAKPIAQSCELGQESVGVSPATENHILGPSKACGTNSLMPPACDVASEAAATDNSSTQNPDFIKDSVDQSCDQAKKPVMFIDLKNKYHSELTYMLREFEKLERQLLGARKTEESAGSRERREKLHSFIIHLQETIDQIESGVQQEAAEPSSGSAVADDSIKKCVAGVEKLEEHILANLLPVKVRLKKQLAAQQGAKHNPAGMPHNGWAQRSDEGVKGTFVAAAEKKRKEAEESYVECRTQTIPVEPQHDQYGNIIDNGGSSLTKKLHGGMLGYKNPTTSELAAAKPEKSPNKIYYGGMALGSDQIESSVQAASSVHRLMIRDTAAMLERTNPSPQNQEVENALEHEKPNEIEKGSLVEEIQSIPLDELESEKPDLDEQERRRRRKRRRRKRQQKEQEVKECEQQDEAEPPKAKKSRQAKKQRGPRHVEYMCALCNEIYSSTCDYNPWWALAQQECPKCHKTQIPRVDISAPANAIEYHPALLAHAEDNGGGGQSAPAPSESETVVSAQLSDSPPDDNQSLGSDVSSGLEDGSSDDEEDSLDIDSDGDDSVISTPADQAENEEFGEQYVGPKLEENDAARLLVLMSHATTCLGQHRNQKQDDVCRSTRWMMLHVRDCPGTTSMLDVCPFPWCRKVKHLLYHLVSCTDWDKCKICASSNLGDNLRKLRGLNEHRLFVFREELFRRKTFVQATGTSMTIHPLNGSHPGEAKWSNDCDLSRESQPGYCLPVYDSIAEVHPVEDTQVSQGTSHLGECLSVKEEPQPLAYGSEDKFSATVTDCDPPLNSEKLATYGSPFEESVEQGVETPALRSLSIQPLDDSKAEEESAISTSVFTYVLSTEPNAADERATESCSRTFSQGQPLPSSESKETLSIQLSATSALVRERQTEEEIRSSDEQSTDQRSRVNPMHFDDVESKICAEKPSCLIDNHVEPSAVA